MLTNVKRGVVFVVVCALILGSFVFSNPTVRADSGVSGFVERLYTLALDRESDPNGKADWINQLNTYQKNGSEVAYSFFFSQEFIDSNIPDDEYVIRLYRTLMNREPDTAGMNDWVNKLQNGSTRLDIFYGFTNSTEWANICASYGIISGGSAIADEFVGSFVERLYTVALGRESDSAGKADWVDKIRSGDVTGTFVAYGFFFSGEYVGFSTSDEDYVSRLYRVFFNREGDNAGKSYWLQRLSNGDSREVVFNGFANSSEWRNYCSVYGIACGEANYTGNTRVVNSVLTGTPVVATPTIITTTPGTLVTVTPTVTLAPTQEQMDNAGIEAITITCVGTYDDSNNFTPVDPLACTYIKHIFTHPRTMQVISMVYYRDTNEYFVSDGRTLSKEDGDLLITSLREQGYNEKCTVELMEGYSEGEITIYGKFNTSSASSLMNMFNNYRSVASLPAIPIASEDTAFTLSRDRYGSVDMITSTMSCIEYTRHRAVEAAIYYSTFGEQYRADGTNIHVQENICRSSDANTIYNSYINSSCWRSSEYSYQYSVTFQLYDWNGQMFVMNRTSVANVQTFF